MIKHANYKKTMGYSKENKPKWDGTKTLFSVSP